MHNTKPISYSTTPSKDLKTSTTYHSHVFATFTYRRDYGLSQSWKSVSSDFNRCLQRIRRLHGCPVQYIRTVEAHADLYPHLHAILQFPQVLRVTNGKYFDQELYKQWRGAWTRGHSDYQCPYSRTKYPILYILKYITKSNATKTLWRKMRPLGSVNPVKNTNSSTPDTESADVVSSCPDPSSYFCSQFKIKQCTWSRGFQFPKIDRSSLVLPPQQVLNTTQSN